ncbi:carbonic anhydrase [Acrocarpospora phusangensis]|uniref:Carbonic anhydrase n=1 Tax=Acrocarpospora phusangensis TaxID=1070424 RepID=A0A919UK56_9ACTN|nr:carbonic anhydrase [Acrocarpospora phusangensis]GIH24709.1 carbonic anhydrase [Acrocarpospora phusangensis]
MRRRRILYGGAVLAGGLLAGAGFVGGVAVGSIDRRETPHESPPRTPDAAWRLLMAGNERWASGHSVHPNQDVARRREVAGGQAPYAVVVSCIDSRVPPEMVFDAGVGDLLAVRTAAHTVDPLVTAAIEYGPEDLRAPLVVVLGHQRCGAVTAAARALSKGDRLPGGLQHIVTALRPAYLRMTGRGQVIVDQLLVESMVRDHTVAVARQLVRDPLLAPRVKDGGLRVMGAYYSLESGRVSRLV